MPKQAIIIGAGPSGLMAAEVLSAQGILVSVYDAMPSAGRKFLQAGRGGLNISHSAPLQSFMLNYYEASPWLLPMVKAFDAQSIQAWMSGLGIESFIGSSGRIFPKDQKAAPLLRAWLNRLKQSGVQFHMKHRFVGWKESELEFECLNQTKWVNADVVVFAMGGASWPQLGSTGEWLRYFDGQGIAVRAFKAANCSFTVAWSDYLKLGHSGEPIKPVVLSYQASNGLKFERQGEMILTQSGLEGGLIYSISAMIRDEIEIKGPQTIFLDLMPSITLAQIRDKLHSSSNRLTLSNKLKSVLKLSAVKQALILEAVKQSSKQKSFEEIAQLIKLYPVILVATGPIEQAISTAGGICRSAVNDRLMLTQKPGAFCVGEMLDWEAPTGGFLLTACLATGRWGAEGAVEWLNQN